MAISRADILSEITRYYDEGDLGFIETINNITFGYKVQLKQQRKDNLTHPTNDSAK